MNMNTKECYRTNLFDEFVIYLNISCFCIVLVSSTENNKFRFLQI